MRTTFSSQQLPMTHSHLRRPGTRHRRCRQSLQDRSVQTSTDRSGAAIWSGLVANMRYKSLEVAAPTSAKAAAATAKATATAAATAAAAAAAAATTVLRIA